LREKKLSVDGVRIKCDVEAVRTGAAEMFCVGEYVFDTCEPADGYRRLGDETLPAKGGGVATRLFGPMLWLLRLVDKSPPPAIVDKLRPDDESEIVDCGLVLALVA